MTFLLISPKNRTAWNFRGDLIRDIVNMGHEVIVTGPNDIDIDKIEANEDCKFVPESAYEGALYPLEGGMNETIKRVGKRIKYSDSNRIPTVFQVHFHHSNFL